MQWFRERALTLVLMVMFVVFLGGQLVAGFLEYNATQREHRKREVTCTEYMATGHPWEAISRTGRASSSRWPSSYC
jgi:hypothetical protein